MVTQGCCECEIYAWVGGVPLNKKKIELLRNL